MPELPEVEVVCRGLKPWLIHQTIAKIIIRQPQLRWPIPKKLGQILPGLTITNVYRRGKYILLLTSNGTLIIHLGMSGRIHFLKDFEPYFKHDHVEIYFKDAGILRYHDPRRFGCILWTDQPYEQHFLLAKLGPEPLSSSFTGAYLFKRAHARKIPIKSFLMDSKIVVGIGNIYANEALFLTGIAPLTSAGSMSETLYQQLATNCKKVLKKAIKAGGTTLNDFANLQGNPGYFSQQLLVYGREGLPCFQCKALLEKIVLNQRSTFYCKKCQN